MKNFLLVVLFLLLSKNSFCMEERLSSYKKNKFEVSLSGAFMGGLYPAAEYSIYFTYDYFFSKNVGFGIGTGYDSFCTPSEGGRAQFENTFPLVLDLRYFYPLGNSRSSFLIVLNAGGLINYKGSHSSLQTHLGGIISPQAGFSFELGKYRKTSLNIRALYKGIYDVEFISVFGLLLGFNF